MIRWLVPKAKRRLHLRHRRLKETLAVSEVLKTVAMQTTVTDPNVNYIRVSLLSDLRGVKSRLGKEPLLRIVLGVNQAVPITMAPVRVQAIQTDSP